MDVKETNKKQGSSITFSELWIARCASNHPKDTIDEEAIHNARNIMDRNGAFIIQGNYG